MEFSFQQFKSSCDDFSYREAEKKATLDQAFRDVLRELSVSIHRQDKEGIWW